MSLIQAKRNEKALTGIQKKIMRTRSTFRLIRSLIRLVAIYAVSLKSIPDIFDCNLKTN